MKNFFKILLASFAGCLIAMAIGTLFLFGLIGSLASFSSKALPVVPSPAVLVLNFDSAIVEQKNDLIDPFATISGTSTRNTGILDFIQGIERAAEDPAIKFIYMNLNTLSAGVSHIEEIRSAITKFRESGKPVIAFADNYSQGSYYLATAADKVYMMPTGMLMMTGVSVNTLFFKDLLEKAGIEVQLIRHGKFKAAAEQLISNQMSPENREQLQAYVDAVWNTWTDEISKSRNIPAEQIDRMTDNLEITTADKVLELKLVDKLMYKDEMLDELAKLFGVEKEKDIKTISMSDYIRATKKVNFKEKNKIAVVYADGDIVMGKSDNAISSDYYANIFSQIRKDSTIKAVVLRINSPGGDARSADIIERELTLLKENKPVIVSMGDYAASGGYWIAAKADKIYTNNTTLTGSIGVFSMVPSVQKALNKHLSITAHSVSSSDHGDMFSGFRALNEPEIEYFRASVEQIYTNFINLVAEGRNFTYEEVDEIAQGRVWSGLDAIEVGLADERGGLVQAIEYAATASGHESYRLVEYPVRKNQMERLMEMFEQASVYSEISDIPSLFEKIYSEFKNEAKALNMARLPYNIYLNN